MLGVVNGRVYNTEVSELIYEREGFRPGETRSLYLSPNGRFFYVYTFVRTQPDFSERETADFAVLGEGCHGFDGTVDRILGKPHDGVALAIKWLEWHGGHEVILERWPERLEAG